MTRSRKIALADCLYIIDRLSNSPEVDPNSPEYGVYIFGLMQPHTIRPRRNLLQPRLPETDTDALIAACDRADELNEVRHRLDVAADRTPKNIGVPQPTRRVAYDPDQDATMAETVRIPRPHNSDTQEP